MRGSRILQMRAKCSTTDTAGEGVFIPSSPPLTRNCDRGRDDVGSIAFARNRHCEEPTGRANARPMTGSATRQSISQARAGLLRRLAPRNDVDRFTTQLRLLAAHCARVLQIHSAPKRRGRREDRVHAAPAVPCTKGDKKTHTSIQVQRRQSGLPCAMVLQLISCSPRRDLACLPPSSRGHFHAT
jgi:hypothetical protein